MYLIQLLLPATRSATTDSGFARTRRELIDAFSGVTAYTRAAAKGAWVAPDGEEEQDEMVLVEVLADVFDRSWWRNYERVLARRFEQEEVHVRAFPIEGL
jgi:hypothetical protein